MYVYILFMYLYTNILCCLRRSCCVLDYSVVVWNIPLSWNLLPLGIFCCLFGIFLGNKFCCFWNCNALFRSFWFVWRWQWCCLTSVTLAYLSLRLQGTFVCFSWCSVHFGEQFFLSGTGRVYARVGHFFARTFWKLLRLIALD